LNIPFHSWKSKTQEKLRNKPGCEETNFKWKRVKVATPKVTAAYYKPFLDLIMAGKDPTHLVGWTKGVGSMRKPGKRKETPNGLSQNIHIYEL
jgi:hypothetical protein